MNAAIGSGRCNTNHSIASRSSDGTSSVPQSAHWNHCNLVDVDRRGCRSTRYLAARRGGLRLQRGRPLCGQLMRSFSNTETLREQGRPGRRVCEGRPPRLPGSESKPNWCLRHRNTLPAVNRGGRISAGCRPKDRHKRQGMLRADQPARTCWRQHRVREMWSRLWFTGWVALR